jgi:hypothetical protein
MANSWRGLCPAVDCNGLMLMMMMTLKGLERFSSTTSNNEEFDGPAVSALCV